jgi:hypothetical protein
LQSQVHWLAYNFDLTFNLVTLHAPNGLRYPRWGGRRNAVRLEKG